jgi:hypothetical protein
MSPHCCDSKLMWQISGMQYGQSANYCSATLVQGTAATSQQWVSSQPATFQQPPQSGDSIIVGCLAEYGTSFSVMDNEQIQGYCNQGSCNTYNPEISVNVPPPPPAGGFVAETSLSEATQAVSSQSQPFTVTCSTSSLGSTPGYISVFALEYADLGSGYNLDGMPQSNSSPAGMNTLSCGSLSTTPYNDLIASVYNWQILVVPQDATDPHPPTTAPAKTKPALAPVPADSCAPQGSSTTTPGTIPACSGGDGGNCVLGYSGFSQYPLDTPPGPYTESWTAWLCPPGCQCVNPMTCVSAAFTVIGP